MAFLLFRCPVGLRFSGFPGLLGLLCSCFFCLGGLRLFGSPLFGFGFYGLLLLCRLLRFFLGGALGFLRTLGCLSLCGAGFLFSPFPCLFFDLLLGAGSGFRLLLGLVLGFLDLRCPILFLLLRLAHFLRGLFILGLRSNNGATFVLEEM
jgi:hypothetical protein